MTGERTPGRSCMHTFSMEKEDPGFKDLVARKIGLQEIKPCYTCGSCTGACPMRTVVEDFDPRRLIHMIVLGLKDKVLSSDTIWLCCFCDSCYTVCPQGIKFARIASELQLMAKDEGYVDERFLEEFRKLDPYLKDVCRRTMFGKVRGGFHGTHKMPCWRKFTVEER